MSSFSEDYIGIQDLTYIDEEMVEKTFKLLHSPAIALSLKTVLLQLLQTINELNKTTKVLYASQENKLLVDQYRIEELDDRGVENKKKQDVIDQVQDYLSKYHSRIFKSAMTGDSREEVKEIISTFISKHNIRIDGVTETHADTTQLIYDELLGFSILEPYMYDKNTAFDKFVEEIRINEYNDIRIVQAGLEKRVDEQFESPKHLEVFVEKLVRASGTTQRFDQTNPFIRLRIGDTTRVSIMRSPIARRTSGFVNGNVFHVRIRKQRKNPFTMQFLEDMGTLGPYSRLLLETASRNGVSMCFYGGTGTGKTGTLAAVIRCVPNDRSVITIAEIDEMDLVDIDLEKTIVVDGEVVPNPNYGKVRNSALMWEITDQHTKITSNTSGFQGGLNAGLTMSPETIVLQEIKGSEMSDMIECGLTDHQVFGTVHASDEEAFGIRTIHMCSDKLSDIDLILRQLPMAFQIIVQIARYADGTRKAASISELVGYDVATKRLLYDKLAVFEVTSIVLDANGKKKVNGSHRALKMPSDKLVERMRRKGGMLDNELEHLKTIYTRYKDMEAA